MHNCILTNCFKHLYFKMTKIDDHFEVISLVSSVNQKAPVVYDAPQYNRLTVYFVVIPETSKA